MGRTLHIFPFLCGVLAEGIQKPQLVCDTIEGDEDDRRVKDEVVMLQVGSHTELKASEAINIVYKNKAADPMRLDAQRLRAEEQQLAEHLRQQVKERIDEEVRQSVLQARADERRKVNAEEVAKKAAEYAKRRATHEGQSSSVEQDKVGFSIAAEALGALAAVPHGQDSCVRRLYAVSGVQGIRDAVLTSMSERPWHYDTPVKRRVAVRTIRAMDTVAAARDHVDALILLAQTMKSMALHETLEQVRNSDPLATCFASRVNCDPPHEEPETTLDQPTTAQVTAVDSLLSSIADAEEACENSDMQAVIP